MSKIVVLFKRELLSEWRQKYAINGILLYLTSTIFICYLSFNVKSGAINPESWNALFWIIIVFAGINAVAKSFLSEPSGRVVYLHSIVSGADVIISRILYNAVLMTILSLVGFLFYSVVLGNPLQDISLFLVTVFLSSTALSTSLTMVSSIASKGSQGATLVAILSFPLIIPIVIISIKAANTAIFVGGFDSARSELLTLVAINVIAMSVSYILFPYLWRS